MSPPGRHGPRRGPFSASGEYRSAQREGTPVSTVRQRRVLAVAGSLRRDSINLALLEAAAQLAPASLAVTVFDGLAAVPLFNEDVEAAGLPPGVQRFRDEVAAADGLLISTPEYNHSMPGVLKNAVDWLSRPAPDTVLVGKPVAVVGVTTGSWGTRLAQAALRQVLFSTQSLVMQRPGVFVRDARDLFDADGRLIDPATTEALRSVMQDFSVWIDLVGRRQPTLVRSKPL
jgi:chromate reductase, NAD(P)H dehydrogenase (quinone)